MWLYPFGKGTPTIMSSWVTATDRRPIEFSKILKLYLPPFVKLSSTGSTFVWSALFRKVVVLFDRSKISRNIQIIGHLLQLLFARAKYAATFRIFQFWKISKKSCKRRFSLRHFIRSSIFNGFHPKRTSHEPYNPALA